MVEHDDEDESCEVKDDVLECPDTDPSPPVEDRDPPEREFRDFTSASINLKQCSVVLCSIV